MKENLIKELILRLAREEMSEPDLVVFEPRLWEMRRTELRGRWPELWAGAAARHDAVRDCLIGAEDAGEVLARMYPGGVHRHPELLEHFRPRAREVLGDAAPPATAAAGPGPLEGIAIAALIDSLLDGVFSTP